MDERKDEREKDETPPREEGREKVERARKGDKDEEEKGDSRTRVRTGRAPSGPLSLVKMRMVLCHTPFSFNMSCTRPSWSSTCAMLA